jgi:hypothetical protein
VPDDANLLPDRHGYALLVEVLELGADRVRPDGGGAARTTHHGVALVEREQHVQIAGVEPLAEQRRALIGRLGGGATAGTQVGGSVAVAGARDDVVPGRNLARRHGERRDVAREGRGRRGRRMATGAGIQVLGQPIAQIVAREEHFRRRDEVVGQGGTSRSHDVGGDAVLCDAGLDREPGRDAVGGVQRDPGPDDLGPIDRPAATPQEAAGDVGSLDLEALRAITDLTQAQVVQQAARKTSSSS